MGCSERMMFLASLYIDDALSDREKEEFNSHLKGCESCRLRLEELMRVSKSLKNMPQLELPIDLHDHVMQRVINAATPINIITKHSANKKHRRSKKHRNGFVLSAGFKRLASSAAMACAALLIFGVVLGLLESPAPVYVDELAAQSDYMSAEADGMTMAGEALSRTEYDAGGGVLPGGEQDGFVVKEFNISVEVDDFDAALEAIDALEGHNDYAQIQYDDGSYGQYADITRRVPADVYEQAKNILRGLGDVVSEDEREQNIAMEVLGNSASLKAKEAESERLSSLLAQSGSVDIMVAVENRLGYVEDQKDALTSRAIYNDDRADYPSIYIRVSQHAKYPAEESPKTLGERLVSTFLTSVQTCISVGEWVLVKASALILPAAALAAVLVIYGRMAKRNKGRDTGGK